MRNASQALPGNRQWVAEPLPCGELSAPAVPTMNINNLQFHIQENDLFGTVATVLDLAKEDIERRGYQKEHAEL